MIRCIELPPLTAMSGVMAKVDSIRDVIAFPKVKDASCLMTQSPSRVSEEQLKELELEVRPEEVTE